jgi:hypothetical protein
LGTFASLSTIQSKLDEYRGNNFIVFYCTIDPGNNVFSSTNYGGIMIKITSTRSRALFFPGPYNFNKIIQALYDSGSWYYSEIIATNKTV